MITEDPVEEFLVPVLQVAEVHVPIDRFFERADVFHHNLCLNTLRPDSGWQESPQAEFFPLLLCKSQVLWQQKDVAQSSD